jgi:hypothetical protein
MTSAAQSRIRFLAMLFGGLFTVLSLFNLGRLWYTPADIWWTPQKLAVALPDAGDRVEVYVGEERLGNMVSQGRIWAGDLSHSRMVQAQELRFVFNNRDRVLADRIPALVSFGAGAGAGLVVLLFALFWKPAKTEEKEAEKAS